MARLRVLAILLAPVLLAACGGEDKAAPAKASGPPAELLGTYRTTLAKGDLPPDPDPVLSDGIGGWTLKIAATGGVDDAPAITLVNDTLESAAAGSGTLETSAFTVAGDRLQLHDEECAASGPVESEYAYKLSGGRLTFTTVKAGCADKVSETILVSHPWAKGG
jgi:hypothetical protein